MKLKKIIKSCILNDDGIIEKIAKAAKEHPSSVKYALENNMENAFITRVEVIDVVMKSQRAKEVAQVYENIESYSFLN